MPRFERSGAGSSGRRLAVVEDRDAARQVVADSRAAARAHVARVLRHRFSGELLETALAAIGEDPAAVPAAARPVRGVWLYGFVRAAPETLPPGVGEAPVALVHHGGMHALVSRVDLEDARAPEHARAHDRVLRAAARFGTVIPRAAGTVHADAASLGQEILQEAAHVEEAFQRLRDLEEWRVQVRARPGAADADLKSAVEVAVDLHGRLSEHASAALLTAPEDASPADGVVLDAAYVLPGPRGTLFRVLVEELAARHEDDPVAVRVSGPQAAHHFGA